MDKFLEIKIITDNRSNKLVTVINKKGYANTISDTLELIGLFDNLKLIQLDNLSKLMSLKKDNKDEE